MSASMGANFYTTQIPAVNIALAHRLKGDEPIQTTQTTKPQDRKVRDILNISVARYNPVYTRHSFSRAGF